MGLLDPDKGKKLENTILVNLIRKNKNIHYYKTKSSDIDFVVTEENRACELIQVSYSIKRPRYIRKRNQLPLEASDKLNCQKLTVVTFNEENNIERNGKVIKVLPAWKWLIK